MHQDQLLRAGSCQALIGAPSATRCLQILYTRNAVTCIVGRASSTGSSVKSSLITRSNLVSHAELL